MIMPDVRPGDLSTCFAQVLMPTDFSLPSWRALTLARSMARTFGAPLRLVHIDTSSPWLEEDSSRLMLRATPEGRSVDVEVLAAREAADGIVQLLGDDESSLLVMSSHGHTGAAELALGSTAEAVLRRWRGPVLTVGPRFVARSVPTSRIVLCVSPDADPSAALVADVAEWGRVLDVPIQLLSVSHHTPTTDSQIIRDEQRRIDDLVDRLAPDGRPAQVVRIRGARAAREIAGYVDELPGTIAAMTTHARPASARVVLGSVAMAVLRQTTSAVLLRRNDPHPSRST